MRILMYADQLVVGGSQTNAIELAAALRDWHGFDVALIATPGPMVELVREKGLRYLPAPVPSFLPSPARMRSLNDAIESEKPDLVHAWDWWECLDAYYLTHLVKRIPMIVSDMTMNVTRILPRRLPTTFGTPELVDQARALGRRCVELLVPPVDVHSNSPRAVDAGEFRQRFAVSEREITLVTVSRLVEQLKGESLFRTVAAVKELGRDLPLRFLIAGEGSAKPKLEHAAADANAHLGREAVTLTGRLLDPRPAYAAADAVVGMGGSALRGMAFAKPVVVVGEQGFAMPFNEETAERFYYTGFYGRGDAQPGNEHLVRAIQGLAGPENRFPEIGAFSRDFVTSRFSLQAVAAKFADFCRRAVTEKESLLMGTLDGLRTAAVYVRERRYRWTW